MTTDDEILRKLSEPFPVDAIHWRVGATNKEKTKGIGLAYIDARDVMDRLDEVVGCDAWQDAYVETNKGRMLCALAVRINGEWITKSDGAGDTDVEGEKGGISDAFKRAAVKFGVGRYLYRLPNTWYPIKARGRSYVLSGNPPLPEWAVPGGSAPPTARMGTGFVDPVANVIANDPAPKPVKKKFNPKDQMGEKLDIMSEKHSEQEVGGWLINFLRHEPLANGALAVRDIKAPFIDLVTIYEHFKEEANRAFGMGFKIHNKEKE